MIKQNYKEGKKKAAIGIFKEDWIRSIDSNRKSNGSFHLFISEKFPKETPFKHRSILSVIN